MIDVNMNKAGMMWTITSAVIMAAMIAFGLRYWNFIVNYDKQIDFVMQIITIAAFILAFVAYLDAKKQGLKLGSIYDSVYTKYIGTFPKHIELLVKHINASNEKIYIAWDAVDIGSFVNPSVHEQFLASITNAIERINLESNSKASGVKFLLLSKPMAVSSAGGIFVIADNLEKVNEFCFHAAQNKAFIESLHVLYKKYSSTDGLDFDNDVLPFTTYHTHTFPLRGKDKAFEVYQLCYHDFIALRLHYAGVDVRILNNANNNDSAPQNFFWVADNGVGSFQGGFLLPASKKSAPAFMTSDPKLIENLSDTFMEHFDNAKKYIREGAVAEWDVSDA